MKQPSDLHARQTALDPKRSFIIQAPAGSGKTELLTDRILALIPTVKRPENILAITFTRKAAAEMHQRVISKLKDSDTELARQARAHDQAQQWHLLESPNRLNISTIDSFCQGLLQQCPIGSQAGVGLTLNSQPRLLYRQVAIEVLQHDLESVNNFLMHLDNNRSYAIELITGMLDKRDQWIDLVQQPKQAITQMFHLLEQLISQHIETHQVVLNHLDWSVIRTVATHSHYHLNEASEWAILADPQTTLPPAPLWNGDGVNQETLTVIHALLKLVSTKEGEKRKSVTKQCGFPTTDKVKKQIMVDLLQGLSERDFEHLTQLTITPTVLSGETELLVDLLRVLDLSLQTLQQHFQQHACVDFQEVALRSLAALGDDNPTELLLKKDYEIQHILIDEFQDTSIFQRDLLKKLMSGWSQNDGRTLFIVGDPMQSIYSFRKAEVGLFLSIWETEQIDPSIPVKVEPLQLTNNFRSQAGIVNWVNQQFSQVFPKDNNIQLGAIQYSPSEAFKEEVPNTEQLPAVQIHTGNTEEITKQLITLCRQALDRHHNSNHFPVAILVRSRNMVMPYLQALKDHHIPINCVDFIPLAQCPEVLDLTLLIQACVLPHDRLVWGSLLRSPLCGLSLQELTTLLGTDKASSVLHILRNLSAPISNVHLADIRHQLLQFYDGQQAYKPLATRISLLWERLGGNRIYADTNAQNNIQLIFQLLEQHSANGDLDIQVFQQAVEHFYASAADSSPAVHIMTMHKAKGLEFEEVILLGLEDGLHHQDNKLIDSLTLLDKGTILAPVKHVFEDKKPPINQFIRHYEQQRTQYEMQRLLYVAATRARQHLHLVLKPTKSAEPPKFSMWKFLEQAIVIPKEQVSNKVQAPTSDNQSTKTTTTVNPTDYTRVQHLSHADRLSLQALSEDTPPPPSEPFEAISLQASIIGTVLHQAMQWYVQSKQMPSDYYQAMITTYLRTLGAQDITQASQAIIHRLQHLDPTLIRYIEKYPCKAEYSIFQASSARQKSVDLLVQLDDKVLIIDYKNSHLHEGESEEDFCQRLQDTYREQLTGYHQILSEHYALQGTNVTIEPLLYSFALQRFIPIDITNLATHNHSR